MPSSSPSRTAERKPGREGRRFPPSGSRYCSKIENSSDLTWQLDIKLAKLKILPWFHNSPSMGRARARRDRGIWAASEGHRYRKSVDMSPELSGRRLEIRIKQKTIKNGTDCFEVQDGGIVRGVWRPSLDAECLRIWRLIGTPEAKINKTYRS